MASQEGHRGDLDFGGSAILAAQRRREQPHRFALSQICQQYAEIDAGPAEPALERFPASLLLGRQLRHFDKGGIGGENSSVAVGDHEAVGRVLGKLKKLRLGEWNRRDGLALYRTDPDQDHRIDVLAEQGGRDQQLRAAARESRVYVVAPSQSADVGHQGLDAVRALGVETVGKGAPHQSLPIPVKQLHGGRVCLQHLLGRGIDDQHRFRRHLEQQAIARLHVAEPCVVSLHRHLRFDQLLLERRDGAKVAAQCHEAIAVTKLHGRVEDRDVDPA